MSEYTSLPARVDTKAMLEACKREGESWDDLLRRLAADDDPADTPDTQALTTRFDELESRLDDFETTAPRKIADELTATLR